MSFSLRFNANRYKALGNGISCGPPVKKKIAGFQSTGHDWLPGISHEVITNF